jgi:hypothetical protein
MRIIKVPNPYMIPDGYEWKLENGLAVMWTITGPVIRFVKVRYGSGDWHPWDRTKPRDYFGRLIERGDDAIEFEPIKKKEAEQLLARWTP